MPIGHLDVAIIGGGWSGILACKYMTENGLNALAFEATDAIGGVFYYRENETMHGGVIRSTHLTSSRGLTEMSDFPMPDDYPDFPSHRQVIDYLNNYVDHFKIRDKILLNKKIVSAKKINEYWELEDQDGNSYRSPYLIVTSGVHQFPNLDAFDDPKFTNATVPKIHAAAYKSPKKEFYDKNILIYGGGESASDIATELCLVANKVIMSIPHGQWLVNRYRRISSHLDKPWNLDGWSSRLRFLVDPPQIGYGALYFIEKDGGRCGHGIKEWENDVPYQGQFLNKAAHITHFMALGSLVPKGELRSVNGDQVVFCDGSECKVDYIIFCTGYKTQFPFLEKKYNVPISDRFMFIFDNDDPSLAFIGFARPVVGSIPSIAELQCMYVSKIFSGKLHLPEKSHRDKVIEKGKAHQKRYFGKTSMRIQGLVHQPIYVDQLSTLAGVYPNYLKLFFSSPKKWMLAMAAPYNNCLYHINDKNQHERVFRTLKNHSHSIFLDFGFHSVRMLLINLFPWFFIETKKSKTVDRLMNFGGYVFSSLLWCLLMPYVLFRVFQLRKQRNQVL